MEACHRRKTLEKGGTLEVKRGRKGGEVWKVAVELRWMHCKKKVSHFPDPSRDVTNLFLQCAALWPSRQFDHEALRGQCIMFSVVFTPHRQCFLPVVSLFLSNSVSPVRACPIIYVGRGFVVPKKKTTVDLLVFNPLWWGCMPLCAPLLQYAVSFSSV